jgi:D-amino peptidase
VRVLISVDMEGITGVTGPQDVTPDTPGWGRFRPIMTRDTNAAIAGAFDGGADDVLVTEAHNSHRNVLLEQLDERARLLTGRHKQYAMVEGIDRGIDVVFFVGYHGPAGSRGVLSHTFFASVLTRLSVNGEACSEARVNALICGAYGVGVGLLTGDDVACEDARRHIPGICTVAVKEAVDRFSAICLPPARTEKLIRQGAQAAMASLTDHKPLVLAPPLVWEATFVGTSGVAMASAVPGVERMDDHQLRWTCADMATSLGIWKAISSIVSNYLDPRFL